MSQSRGAGLGGIAFGILAFGALIVANVPGGNYKASDVTKYLAHGHRPAVFVGAYLTLLAAVGLLLLLAQLRASIDGARASSIFWGLAIGAAAAWIAGFMIIASPVSRFRSAAASCRHLRFRPRPSTRSPRPGSA